MTTSKRHKLPVPPSTAFGHPSVPHSNNDKLSLLMDPQIKTKSSSPLQQSNCNTTTPKAPQVFASSRALQRFEESSRNPSQDETLDQNLSEQNQIIVTLQDMVNALQKENDLCLEKIKNHAITLQQLSEMETHAHAVEKRMKYVVSRKDVEIIELQRSLARHKDRLRTTEEVKIAMEDSHNALISSMNTNIHTQHISILQLQKKLQESNREVEKSKVKILEMHALLQSKEVEISRFKHSVNSLHEIMQETKEISASLQSSIKEKDKALDALSSILAIEKKKNDQLQKKMKASVKPLHSSLYDELLGRNVLTVELERNTQNSSLGFKYEVVAGPITSAVSYLIVKQVSSPFLPLELGDVILEVNGHSCRKPDLSAAVQQLKESIGIIKMVITREDPPSNEHELPLTLTTQPNVGSSKERTSNNLEIETPDGIFHSKSLTPPPLPITPPPFDDVISEEKESSLEYNHKSGSNDPDTVQLKNLSTQLTELHNVNSQLKAALDNRNHQIEEMQTALEIERKERQKMSLQLTRSETTLTEGKSENEHLCNKIKEAERHCALLEEELNQCKLQLEISSETALEEEGREDNLAIELSKFKVDQEAVKRKLQYTTARLEAETNQYQKELQAYKQKERFLKEESSKLTADRNTVMETLRTSEQTNSNLHKQLSQYKSELEMTQTNVKKLETKKEILEKSINKLKVDLQNKSSDHKTAADELVRMTKENATIKTELEDCKQQMRELTLDSETARMEENKLRERLASMERDLQGIKTHAGKLEEDLREKVNDIIALQSTIDSLNSAVHIAHTQVKEEQGCVATINEELKIAKEELQSMQLEHDRLKEYIQKSREDKSKRDIEISGLQQEVGELKKHSDMVRSKLENEIRNLEEELYKLRMLLDTKQIEVDTTKESFESQVLSYKSKLQISESEKESLSEQLVELLRTEGEEELCRINTQLHIEATQAKEEVQQLSIKLNTMQKETLRIQQELEEAEQRISDIIEENTRISDDMNNRYIDIQIKMKDTKAELEEQRGVSHEKETKVKELLDEVERVNNKYRLQLKAVESKFTDERDLLSRKVSELKARHELVESKLVNSEAQFESKSKECANLKESQDRLHQYLEKLLAVVMEYQPTLLEKMNS